MSEDRADTANLLKAIEFASRKHSTQRRKDADASPYINHPIAVTRLLADTGGVTDLVTLMAAVLHDTVEDTKTTAEELEAKSTGFSFSDFVHVGNVRPAASMQSAVRDSALRPARPTVVLSLQGITVDQPARQSAWNHARSDGVDSAPCGIFSKRTAR